MKKRLILTLILLLSLTLAACNNNDNDTRGSSQQEGNSSGEYDEIGSGANRVKFPKDLEKGIVFATYDRGSTHEDIYVNNKEAIEAVQKGEEMPSGTVITLVGYEDGEIDQYLVMEKRTGWGSQYSPEERNGEWEYQHFNPDREVANDNIGRCFACHANQERDQYMNSMDQMKEFDLGEVSQSKNSSTEKQTASMGWKVNEVSVHQNGSNGAHNEESSLMGDEEKSGIVKDLLLTMYLQQYKN